jgi:hypothetical protein
MQHSSCGEALQHRSALGQGPCYPVWVNTTDVFNRYLFKKKTIYEIGKEKSILFPPAQLSRQAGYLNLMPGHMCRCIPHFHESTLESMGAIVGTEVSDALQVCHPLNPLSPFLCSSSLSLDPFCASDLALLGHIYRLCGTPLVLSVCCAISSVGGPLSSVLALSCPSSSLWCAGHP